MIDRKSTEIHERQQQLRGILQANITNVLLKWGDGYQGWGDYAPYDGILVTAVVNKVPDALFKQVKQGGRIVIPLEKGEQHILYVITHYAEHNIEMALDPICFVPFLSGTK